MKNFIAVIFATFLIIGVVGSAGATSFTIGHDWSHLDGINFGPGFSYHIPMSANTFNWLHGGTFRTNEVFGRVTGWESGGVLGRSFFSNLSYGSGGIISSGPHDDMGWRNRIKKINKSGDTASVAPVPEPATILMVGIGLVALANVARKKIKP